MFTYCGIFQSEIHWISKIIMHPKLVFSSRFFFVKHFGIFSGIFFETSIWAYFPDWKKYRSLLEQLKFSQHCWFNHRSRIVSVKNGLWSAISLPKSICLLICTLIFENQGLHRTLENISGCEKLDSLKFYSGRNWKHRLSIIAIFIL